VVPTNALAGMRPVGALVCPNAYTGEIVRYDGTVTVAIATRPIPGWTHHRNPPATDRPVVGDHLPDLGQTRD